MTHCKSEVTQTRRRFEQGRFWIPSVLLVLSLTALAAAVWQWQRHHLHQTLAAQAQLAQLNPVALSLNAAGLPASVQSAGQSVKISVQGQWLAQSTTFISPRLVNGKSGAWVLSVLQYAVDGQTRQLVVQRGWAAQPSVQAPPVLAPLSLQAVTLEGDWVAQLPRAYELSKINPQALGLWQNYDAARYAALLGLRLDAGVLVLSPSSPDAEAQRLHRDNPANASQRWQDKADKNLAYALQWLLLALVGGIGLLVLLLSAKRAPPLP